MGDDGFRLARRDLDLELAVVERDVGVVLKCAPRRVNVRAL